MRLHDSADTSISTLEMIHNSFAFVENRIVETIKVKYYSLVSFIEVMFTVVIYYIETLWRTETSFATIAPYKCHAQYISE